MPMFAKICTFLQKSADFCENLQTLAKICRFLRKFANFCENFSIFARKFWAGTTRFVNNLRMLDIFLDNLTVSVNVTVVEKSGISTEI